MSEAENEEKQPGFWALDSGASKTVNGWAIVETIIAILAFYYVSTRWEALWLLWSSIFIAPLLFLRSPASIAFGAKLFENGFFPVNLPNDQTKRRLTIVQLRNRRGVIIATIGILIGLGLGYPQAKNFLFGQEGAVGFWRDKLFEITIFMMLWSTAIAIAMAMPVAGLEASTLVEQLPGAAARAVKMAGAVAVLVAVAGAVAGVFSGTIEITGVRVGTVAGAGAAAGAAVLAALVLPVAGGIVIWSSFVRILTVARHLIEGFAEMRDNIWNLAFCTSPLHRSELMPGLSGKSFSFTEITKRIRKQLSRKEYFEALISIFLIIFWVLLGRLERFILMGTLWLWGVLLIFGRPLRTTSADALKADSWGKLGAKLGVLSAVFIVAGSLAVPFLKAYFAATEGSAKVLISAVFVFIDFSVFSPFQMLGLVTGAMAVIGLFWAADIIADSRVKERLDEIPKRLKRIGIFNNINAGLGYISKALLFVYVILLVNAHYAKLFSVHPFVFNWLQWIFGAEYAEMLRF